MGAIRNLAKRVLFSVLEPASRVYLSKERKYRYKGLRVFVPPTVFHPAFYLSTPILLGQLEVLDLQDLQFCELGAGSGIVSLLAASKGAQVTALEINPVAVDAIRRSADHNDLELRVFRSDLFSALESETFDFLVVNPPYYPKAPDTDKDRAFFCGADFEFFQAFFSQLRQYLNPNATVWMILSEDCDLERIKALAQKENWQMEVDYQVRKYREWHYIFRLFT